jgi:hypothetical protein
MIEPGTSRRINLGEMQMGQEFKAWLDQLQRPAWFNRPEDWDWARPDGQSQGLSAVSRMHMGMFNLSALALEGKKQDGYNLEDNELTMWVLRNAAKYPIGASNLAELALLMPPKSFSKAVKNVKEKHVRKLAELAEAL